MISPYTIIQDYNIEEYKISKSTEITKNKLQ
jgi:hypothetical protein